MKAWFLSLTERERYLLVATFVFLFSVFLWFGVWQPLTKYQKRLKAELEDNAKTLEILQGAQQQLASYKPVETTMVGDTGTSVQLLISPLLQNYGLNNEKASSEAKGTNGVTLKLQEADFDKMISLLGDLESQQGIYITGMSLIPTETPGLTGAQLSLER
ncbi:type II secretion system protein GspM [Thiolinea disciformis]|uniref:type II secretion system protein GspM n=1 Tax=Thiolinea disciformis TaxID=125614 RepID=UPI000368F793|nr:type II secretion system protein GspM [Thiolinea disciformis]